MRSQCVEIIQTRHVPSERPRCLRHNIVHVLCVTINGVLNRVLDILTTYTHDSELQVITAPALISTLFQITTVPSMSFPVYVFTSRSLATASNNGDPSASRAHVLSERRLPSNCLFSSQTPVQNWLGCSSCLPHNSSARTTQTTPFILVCVSFVAERVYGTVL
jgi:hypothetical protein